MIVRCVLGGFPALETEEIGKGLEGPSLRGLRGRSVAARACMYRQLRTYNVINTLLPAKSELGHTENGTLYARAACTCTVARIILLHILKYFEQLPAEGELGHIKTRRPRSEAVDERVERVVRRQEPQQAGLVRARRHLATGGRAIKRPPPSAHATAW
jgi:hypothetical protein